jgi:hypothetical protein
VDNIAGSSGKNKSPTFLSQYIELINTASNSIRCSGNVFNKPLPNNDRLFWLYYSGLQALRGDIDTQTAR